MALIQEVQNRGTMPRHTGTDEGENINRPNVQAEETKATDTEPTTDLEKPIHTIEQMATTQNSSWY